MEWAIDLQGLQKTFGEKVAVEDLTLQIPEGSIFGFLGPNGAGKTTTIKMMLGLLRPDQGGGKILGHDIAQHSVALRQKVGYVAEVQSLYEYMSVEGILEFCRPFYPRWNRQIADKYLKFFDLPKKQQIKNLSKGMKTQLALVIAMAPEPELLILDEPTSGLDAINRQEFLRIVLEELAVQGRTVFFSSHLLHDVERIADHVAIINQGRLIEVRDVDQLKTTVKKIRIVFQHEPKDDLFSLPGVVNVAKEGSAYVVSVEDNLQEILQRFKSVPHFTLDVIDRNLEDIFIEKVRGDS
ncbi:ABC transporter ATP-binding protein [Dethiobacter alkaliphilus]|uniref:ABC transporter ATP-binding protein n=1 Tax=Dethiobacter alkaliphilus TaxID=427926 RepID=UPI002226B141|nr:ABC transporter ATP-binding protein [Dethiobacter alkaliphilus]MCW3491664.1 ABC transporter ATP-binding protein [Dethiobacter alkaliphilus]